MNKICHITTVHQRYDVRIFEKECTSLAQAGYDVSLIVADGKGDEVKNNIKIYDIGKPVSRRERMLKYPKKAYQKALELNADLYHFHDPELLKTGLKLRKAGKLVVYDVHEDVPKQILSKYYLPKIIRPFLAFYSNIFEKRIVKKLSGFVTPLQTVIERLGKVNPNYEFVANYPILYVSEEKIEFSNRARAVSYVGGITKIRGITYLVDAMQFTDDIQLFLAGEFESKDLENQVKNST